MVRVVRQLAVRTLTLPGVVPLMQRWNRHLGIIFMLHRFAWPERGISGQDPASLRQALAFLRQHGFRVLPVADLLEWARTPEADRAPGPVVAFTLDDGYVDQAGVAARIFAEFDAPATIFPTTGFLDGDLWMWWDRLRHLVESTDRGSIPCPELRPPPEEVPIETPAERQRVFAVLERTMKRTSIAEREARIAALSQILDVELPSAPPATYAPMSWSDARRCEAAGVDFGPHTVTHPTLACEREEQVRREVRASWARLREELEKPVPIFCYPNGRFGDFGRREARIAAEAGLAGAVTAEPGYVLAANEGSGSAAPGFASPYELPRYSLPELHRRLVRIVAGLSPAGRQGVLVEPGVPTDLGSMDGMALPQPRSLATSGD